MSLFNALFTIGFTGFMTASITFDSVVVRIICLCIFLFGLIGGALYEDKQNNQIEQLKKEIEKIRGANNAR